MTMVFLRNWFLIPLRFLCFLLLIVFNFVIDKYVCQQKISKNLKSFN